jgi:hypothetical protein
VLLIELMVLINEMESAKLSLCLQMKWASGAYLAVGLTSAHWRARKIDNYLIDQVGTWNKQYQNGLATTNKQTNSVSLVRERTIPTEWPLLVGEVSAKFSG